MGEKEGVMKGLIMGLILGGLIFLIYGFIGGIERSEREDLTSEVDRAAVIEGRQ